MTGRGLDVGDLTEHFTQWQGLRWVPVGVGTLVAAPALTGVRQGPVLVILLVAALALGAADVWVDDYYKRVFGQVRAPLSQRLTWGISRVAVVVPAAAVGVADVRYRFPVLFSGLVFGALVVVFWQVTGRGRWHWPVLALAPIIAAFAPTVGVSARGRPSLVVLLVVVGIVEIVGGILDHRMLVRKIGAIRDGLHT